MLVVKKNSSVKVANHLVIDYSLFSGFSYLRIDKISAMNKKSIFLPLLLLCNLFSFAQNDGTINSKYDPHALFSPIFYPAGGTISRAATGEPNVGYWQNKIDYKIVASLNDVSNEITGSVVINKCNMHGGIA